MLTRSYIEGASATQKDISVFKAIAAPGEGFPNAQRWYSHIYSFSPEKVVSLPGTFEALAPSAAAPAAKGGGAPKPEKKEKAPKEEKAAKAPKEEKKAAAATPDVSDAPAEGPDLRLVKEPVKPPRMSPKAPVAALGQFYITTAINYANGSPHMGHAYEAIAADVIARYHRMYGREVYFLTGADEHGQKIADTAEKAGIKPQELVDRSVAQFKHLDWTLGCEFDGYVRTTSDAHKKLCRRLWEKCTAAGDVVLGEYEGWYNVREECFVPDNEVRANQRSNLKSASIPPPAHVPSSILGNAGGGGGLQGPELGRPT